jgi:Family of unknown function (DUF6209)
MECSVRFQPSGASHSESVLEEIREPPEGGPVVGHVPKPVTLAVPVDATAVELWFHTFTEPGLWGVCDAWDSQFGQNYWFPVSPSSGSRLVQA